MDENVVTTEQTVTEQAEPAKTEPVKEPPREPAKPDNTELTKLKAALSKANSEAAEYRRLLREKQTEQERIEADRLEQEKAMREELELLRKSKTVTDYTNRAMAVGFDADTAASAANAMADGDMDAMFGALKAFVEATTTRLNNEALNRQPVLSTGVPPTTNTTVDTEYENMRRWMGAPTRR